MLSDLIQHKTHQFFWQIAVNIVARRGGSDVRTGPRELVNFGRNNPGSLCIQTQASSGGRRNLYAVFIFEWRRMGDREHISGGAAAGGEASKHDAARTVLPPVLPARACFVPPQIGVSNDLTRLWKRKRHPAGGQVISWL